MLAVSHVTAGVVNTLGHQPSPDAFVQVPHEEPLVPVLATDAARTLIRNRSSISHLLQGAGTCKVSSSPGAAAMVDPAAPLAFWATPFPISALPAHGQVHCSVFWGRCLLCELSHPSSVVVSPCPRAAVAMQGPTLPHRHPFVGMNKSSQKLRKIKTVCVLD